MCISVQHGTCSAECQGRALNYKYLFLHELISLTGIWAINNALKYDSVSLLLMIRPQKAWFSSSISTIHSCQRAWCVAVPSILTVIPNDAGVTVQVGAGVLAVAVTLCATTQVHTSYIIQITFLIGQLVLYQCLSDIRWHEQVLKIKILQGVVQVRTGGVSPDCGMKSSSKQVLSSKAPEWHTLYPDTTSDTSAKITDFFSKWRGRHKIIDGTILICSHPPSNGN